MKRNPNVCHWIDCGHWPVYLAFCPSKKAWKAQMKHLHCDAPYPHDKGVHSAATGAVFSNFNNWPTSDGKLKDIGIITIVPMRDGHSSMQMAAMLIHEIVHVKQWIMRQTGEKKMGRETEAYLVQSLVQSCLYAYNDHVGFADDHKPRSTRKKRN